MSQSRVGREVDRKTRQAEKLLEQLKNRHEKKKHQQEAQLQPNLTNSGMSFKTCLSDNYLSDLYFRLFSQHTTHHDPNSTIIEIQGVFNKMKQQILGQQHRLISTEEVKQRQIEKIEELNNILDEQKKSLKQRQSEGQSWKNLYQQLKKYQQNQQESCKQKIESESLILKRMQEDIGKKNNQIADLWKINRQANTDLRKYMSLEKNLVREKQQLEFQNSQMCELLNKMKNQLITEEIDSGKKPEDIFGKEEMMEKYQNILQKNKILEEKLQMVQNNSISQMANFSKQQEQKKKLQLTIQELKASNGKYYAQNQQLKVQNHTIKKENEELNSQNMKLNQVKSSLIRQIEIVKQNQQEIQKEKNYLQGQLISKQQKQGTFSEQKINSLTIQFDDLSNQHSKLMKEYERNLNQLNQVKDRFNFQKEENLMIIHQREQIYQKMLLLEKKVEKFEENDKKLVYLNQTNEKLQYYVAELEVCRQQKQKQNQLLKKKATQLQKQLVQKKECQKQSNSRKKVQELSSQILYREEEAKTEKERHEREVEILKEMLNQSKSINQELADYKNKYNILRIQYNTLKQRKLQTITEQPKELCSETVNGLNEKMEALVSQKNKQSVKHINTIRELTQQLEIAYQQLNKLKQEGQKGSNSSSFSKSTEEKRKKINSNRPRSVNKLTSYFSLFRNNSSTQ